MSDFKTDPGQGQNYWRSLQELADSDEFRRHLENEFPGGVDVPEGGLNRRRFLQIMAASVAHGGGGRLQLARGEDRPVQPPSRGHHPGQSKLFATALEIGGAAMPVLATSFDGRPIKIDGNPDLSLSGGATSAVGQASVLDLYDPDRSRGVVRRSGRQETTATWDDVVAFLAEQRGRLAAGGGAGLAILAEASSSPSRAALRASLEQRFPRLRWYEHEPVDRASEREGTRLAFGRACQVLPDLEAADVVVDLDADLLHAHPTALRNARQFARRRRPEKGVMNRLYVFEPTPSVTGAMADHHQPTAPAEIPRVLYALAAELAASHGVALPGGLAAAVRPYAGGAGEWQNVVAKLARDLAAHRGAVLVAVGDRQPATAHAVCAALNEALGSAGKTVHYVADTNHEGLAGGLPELTRSLEQDQVKLLVIIGGNPVYSAPGDLDFARALRRAENSLHLSNQRDETSRLCHWHVNRTHYLESWGDLLAPDGTHLAQQPLIAPAVRRQERSRAALGPGRGHATQGPCDRPPHVQRALPVVAAPPPTRTCASRSVGDSSCTTASWPTAPPSRWQCASRAPRAGSWRRPGPGPRPTPAPAPTPSSRCSSPRHLPCTTGASPTTPGCRNCPIPDEAHLGERGPARPVDGRAAGRRRRRPGEARARSGSPGAARSGPARPGAAPSRCTWATDARRPDA